MVEKYYTTSYKINDSITKTVAVGTNYMIPRLTMNYDVNDMEVFQITAAAPIIGGIGPAAPPSVSVKTANGSNTWSEAYVSSINSIIMEILTCCRFYAIHNPNLFMKRQYHILKIILGYHCNLLKYINAKLTLKYKGNIETKASDAGSIIKTLAAGKYPFYNIPEANFILVHADFGLDNEMYIQHLSPYDINMMIHQLLDIQFNATSLVGNISQYGVFEGLERILHKLKTRDLYAMDFDKQEEEILLSLGLRFTLNLVKSSHAFGACKTVLAQLVYHYIASFLLKLQDEYMFNKNFEGLLDDPNSRYGKILQYMGQQFDTRKLKTLVKKYEHNTKEKTDANAKLKMSEFMKYIILYDSNSGENDKYKTYFNYFKDTYESISANDTESVVKNLFNLLCGLVMSFNRKVIGLISLQYPRYSEIGRAHV